MTIEARKINDELSIIIHEAESAIQELQGIRKGQAELDEKILQLIKAKNSLDFSLKTCIYELEKQWTAAEKVAVGIGQKIDKEEAARLQKIAANTPAPAPATGGKDDDDGGAANTNKKFWPTDVDTLTLQEKEFNMKISDVVEMREKLDKVDCHGMPGYEVDKPGVGLSGEYYNNEGWTGAGKKRIDHTIDFNWKGSSPMNGINPYNYSVKWEGYLLAPFTGYYKFTVESNDSTMVVLNNKVLIALNMKTIPGESNNRNTVWMEAERYLAKHPSIMRSKASSKDTFLMGGARYK